MSSDVDICNMAASHLGDDTVITSISPPDGSVLAGHCARFYPIARREAIERGKYSWAKTRAELAEVTNPSAIWGYAYALPSNCIKPLRVLDLASWHQFTVWPWPWSVPMVTPDEMVMFTERGTSNFDIENGVLLTHQPNAVLLYIRDVTDTTKFGPTMCSGLSYLLAGYLAGPVIKGKSGADAGRSLREGALGILAQASTMDANSSNTSSGHIPDHVKVR